MNRYVRFEFFAQPHEKIQHLRLDRHVERGDRFVADQEIGLHRQRAGDADARALAAGKLVRKAPHRGRRRVRRVASSRRRTSMVAGASPARARPAPRR